MNKEILKETWLNLYKDDLVLIEKLEVKDTSLIPEGNYCEDCPYLDKDLDRPKQMNGYCHYLEKGDWERSYEMEIREPDTGRIITKKEKDEIPFSFSLIWDGVKECSINK